MRTPAVTIPGGRQRTSSLSKTPDALLLSSSWPRAAASGSPPSSLKLTRGPKPRRLDARTSPRKAPPRKSVGEFDVTVSPLVEPELMERYLSSGLDEPVSADELGDSGCWDASGSVHLVETVFAIDEVEMDKYIGPVLGDYFHHGIVAEVAHGISPLIDSPGFNAKLVEYIITEALHRNADERALGSALLTQLELSQSDIMDGVQEVLTQLPELKIDVPDAVPAVAKVVAYLLVDGSLPADYPQVAGPLPGPTHTAFDFAATDAALKLAEQLVTRSALTSNRVWTQVGPRSSLEQLKGQIDEAVAEYRDSADAVEVGRCLGELQVPHFHHQLVFATILSSLEHGTGRSSGRGDGGGPTPPGSSMHELLFQLSSGGLGLVPPVQMIIGFRRVYQEMPSIQLDLPWAYALLHTFVKDAVACGYLPSDIAAEAPKKPPRKRRHTVSCS